MAEQLGRPLRIHMTATFKHGPQAHVVQAVAEHEMVYYWAYVGRMLDRLKHDADGVPPERIEIRIEQPDE